LAVLDVRERAKAIVLDLKQPVRVIERLTPSAESHGLERKEHRLYPRISERSALCARDDSDKDVA
jgi:hypothetical protein